MPRIEWTEDMSVGIAEFDEQHRQILEAINRLNEAIEAGASETDQLALLDEAIRITRHHFETEERVFEEFEYPGKVTHKCDHDKILEQMHQCRACTLEGHPSRLEIDHVCKFGEWVEHHVVGSDRHYTGYLNAKGVR